MSVSCFKRDLLLFVLIEINWNGISHYGGWSLELHEFREFTEFGVGDVHLEKSVLNQGSQVFQRGPIGFFVIVLMQLLQWEFREFTEFMRISYVCPSFFSVIFFCYFSLKLTETAFETTEVEA